MRIVFIIILALYFTPLKSQNNAGKFGLEITKLKVGINAGPYRGRTPQTNGPFNQGIAGFGQIYFPFQWSVDYQKNYNDSLSVKNEYNNRLFLIRPSAILHVVDNESLAFGLGLQFSFLITKQFYLEYQLSGVYLEATKEGLPDLNDGFNLHHFVSVSKPISRHFSLSLGLIHLSSAGLGNGINSNQDVVSAGVKWNL
ncbi:MAG: hypothetical protein JKY30_11280 [Flavobacteriales bacterium]|nr:hypothetical protein [Flavobacteriales bacterium]